MYSHLGDTLVDMLVRVFLERFDWKGKIHLNCGWHCPLGEGPWLYRKRKRRKQAEHERHLALLSVNSVTCHLMLLLPCLSTAVDCTFQLWARMNSAFSCFCLAPVTTTEVTNTLPSLDGCRWSFAHLFLCCLYPACCYFQCNAATQCCGPWCPFWNSEMSRCLLILQMPHSLTYCTLELSPPVLLDWCSSFFCRSLWDRPVLNYSEWFSNCPVYWNSQGKWTYNSRSSLEKLKRLGNKPKNTLILVSWTYSLVDIVLGPY